MNKIIFAIIIVLIIASVSALSVYYAIQIGTPNSCSQCVTATTTTISNGIWNFTTAINGTKFLEGQSVFVKFTLVYIAPNNATLPVALPIATFEVVNQTGGYVVGPLLWQYLREATNVTYGWNASMPFSFSTAGFTLGKYTLIYAPQEFLYTDLTACEINFTQCPSISFSVYAVPLST